MEKLNKRKKIWEINKVRFLFTNKGWMIMPRLDNKVAIVTGSGSGIGKEIALTYAREGANIVVADFNEAGIEQTVNELNELGTKAIGVKVNVTNEEDISKMVEETVKAFGTIDILVNNAGISDNMQSAANVTDDVWERVMNLNFESPS